MIYTTSELTNILGSFAKIKTAVKRGKYYKVSYGLYSDKSPFLGELENLFARYPNAILTLQSAFAFYEMSDFVPNKYVLATSQKAHRISNDKVEQMYISNELLNIGKTTLSTNYGVINIYDKERLLIELFRLKSKLAYPYFKELVNSYREMLKEDMIDNNKIVKYCSMFKKGNNIRKQIEEVIL